MGARHGEKEGKTMAFRTKMQQDTYEKIADWLKAAFGEMLVTAIPDAPVFVFHPGDTLAEIVVAPWGDDDATITVRSWVVQDVEVTRDLMHYLLRENDRFRFGGFGLDSEDDVFFEHTIVGSTCDPEELRASVIAVSGTSDRYDDEIIARFGGVKSIEHIRHKVGA